jgi:hypothetical protein
MSCNNGHPVYRANPIYKEITACEENDSEVLLTKAAVTHLQWATAPENSSRPFFIAMGHHKPHLPWNVPSRFYAQYGDPAALPLAAVRAWPESAPTISWHPWFDQQVMRVLSGISSASRRARPH